MSEHVTIDSSKPTALGVHYVVPTSQAVRHFTKAGFHGIEGMRVFEQAENCNEARRRALSAAREGQGKCFWQGDWDYSANPCQIYAFEYTSYDGPTFTAPRTANTEAHVDWREG